MAAPTEANSDVCRSQVVVPRALPLLDSKNELPAEPASSALYRHRDFHFALAVRPAADVDDVPDILCRSARLYPRARAIGARPLLRVDTDTREDGNGGAERKAWTYFVLGSYYWMTYSEFYAAALIYGKALRTTFSLQPRSLAVIYARTCPEWQISAFACLSQNVAVVTCYESLGRDALCHALNETEAPLVFVHSDLVPSLQKVLPECPKVTGVVVMTPYVCQYYAATCESSNKAKIPTEYAGLSHALAEAEALRKKLPSTVSVHLMHDLIPPKKVSTLAKKDDLCTAQKKAYALPINGSDLACVMYTSGSTGMPKGVMLTHSNILASVAGVLGVIPGILRPIEDVYIAYLPLAHVLEFAIECGSLFSGCALGYGHPRTLTDLSVRDCANDIRELCPTYMAGVPFVWEGLQKKIREEVAKAPFLLRAIFNAATALKQWSFNRGMPGLMNFLDKTVLKRVREKLGGRLRFCVSGGAPLAPVTQQFLTRTICPVIQCYGLTETCGAGTFYNFGMPLYPGSSGPIAGCLEMRLEAVENSPQYDPRSATAPTGELLLRGGNVFKGYYKRPELTAEVLSESGWFRTGDIATLDVATGVTSIVDRVKNLVKLGHGEYIALEKLESLYSTAPIVARICIVAEVIKSVLIAVVQPTPAALQRLESSKKEGKTVPTIEELCKDADVQNQVLQILLATAKEFKLSSVELVRGVVLSDFEWTPDSGVLTAAMKIRRKEVESRYSKEIAAVCEQL